MFCYKNEKKHLLVWLNSIKVKTRVNKLPAIFRGGGVFLLRDSRDLSRDLARFGPFDEAELWSHDSFPNHICKNLGQSNICASEVLCQILTQNSGSFEYSLDVTHLQVYQAALM